MTAAPARSAYIVSPEGHTGKSVVALGVLDLLTRRVQKVGVFRPVTTSTTGDYTGEVFTQPAAAT